MLVLRVLESNIENLKIDSELREKVWRGERMEGREEMREKVLEGRKDGREGRNERGNCI